MAQNSRNFNYERQLKYYYIRFLRLRGEPHELALGMALGVFCGMMPILPFQIALAVALALLFKASKITAALGTWASNPLNWYFIYLYDFKLGAYLLGQEGGLEILKSVMASISRGDEMAVIWGKVFSSGMSLASSLLVGGILIGAATAVPTYFIFLKVFQKLIEWRQKRKTEKALKVKKRKKTRSGDSHNA